MAQTISELHVATGAFGYSGKYMAARLLDSGHRLRTLTNYPLRAKVEAHPLIWDEPERLAASLPGAKVLYNTYWVRFDHRTFKHSVASELARRKNRKLAYTNKT
jgi:hypothetical protein